MELSKVIQKINAKQDEIKENTLNKINHIFPTIMSNVEEKSVYFISKLKAELKKENNDILFYHNWNEDFSAYSLKAYSSEEINMIFMKKLFVAALQQFNFWLTDSEIRTKWTSSAVHTAVYECPTHIDLIIHFEKLIKSETLTLREERLALLEKSREYLQKLSTHQISQGDVLKYLYDCPLFEGDFYKKKREYFLISIVRHFISLESHTNDSELLEAIKLYKSIKINPCIDYQIPKMLEINTNILEKIDYDLYTKILNCDMIIKDSREELKFRSLYYALFDKICNETKLTPLQLDNYLFFNRNKFTQGISHIRCLTTYY